MGERRALTEQVARRYRRADRKEKAVILSAGIPVTGRLRGQPGGGGSMGTSGSASHDARRRHSASIRDLRADRHPNEPHSGPLRPLRAVGGTLGHPLDRPSMALGRGGPACISPAAGLHVPSSTLRRCGSGRSSRQCHTATSGSAPTRPRGVTRTAKEKADSWPPHELGAEES